MQSIVTHATVWACGACRYHSLAARARSYPVLVQIPQVSSRGVVSPDPEPACACADTTGLQWGARQGERVSDAELAELLEEVSLPGLATKLGGLDAEADWARLLSQGEQQRVALLRLLLHQPLVAFLDEVSPGKDDSAAPCVERVQHAYLVLLCAVSCSQSSLIVQQLQ